MSNKTFNKSKFKEWFNRYKFPELAATTTALLFTQFRQVFNGFTTAYLITIGEYFAFYGVILFMEYQKLFRCNRSLNKKTALKEIVLLGRNLLFEFGYPSLLDFFLIRPFFMYWMPILCRNYFIGIVLGKISADSFFYGLTILNYEIMKRKKQ